MPLTARCLTLMLVLLCAVPSALAREDIYAVTRSAGQDLAPAGFPSLMSAVRDIGPLDFCGEAVPLDNPEVRERLEKELLLILWDRAQVILYIKRSGRYFPYIEAMLDKRDMPEDLKYMAVIESALKPHAGSSAGAVGYWQFIRPTGKKYGLQVDADIDERRNIYLATRAALDYLSELHGMFGSWTLAAAAYNMGESGLEKRIKQQETEDYYNLYLPFETQAYVFRALAVKAIMSDPARYGFDITEDDLYKPLEFDRVTVKAAKPIPIQLIAKAAGTYFKTIKDMNTHLLGADLPRGTHSILVPRGAGGDFYDRFDAVLKSYTPPAAEYEVYKVRKGDTLLGIANRFHIPINTLLRKNGLSMKSNIYPGQRLIIPQ